MSMCIGVHMLGFAYDNERQNRIITIHILCHIVYGAKDSIKKQERVERHMCKW
jgi:hypothetical protein